METKFNFNSQICTSRSQSERLLALGLKKETADMRRPHYNEHTPWVIDERDCLNEHWLPAWSLHRLIEMMPKVIKLCYPNLHFTMLHDSVHYCDFDYNEEFEQVFSAKNNIYENIIDCYEWLIKNWYFDEALLNKE